MVKNSLSIDLESFIYRELDPLKRGSDDGYTPRATRRLLDILDKYDAKVTFFVLGQIYQWYPELIVEVKERGHEIGYHGHTHTQIVNRNMLLSELKLSTQFIRKYKPIGFRAPRMYLPEECLGVLREHGFAYDSSIYGGSQFRKSGITEIPVSTWSIFNSPKKFPRTSQDSFLAGEIPYGSGLSFSLFGKLLDMFINHENKKGNSSVLFIHPWQLAPYTLKVNKNRFLSMIVYKANIIDTLDYLLSRYKFIPMSELVKI